MAQDEPQDDDTIQVVDGINFAVEKEIGQSMNSINIDFANGWFKKGYTVYADGYRGRC